MAAMTKYQVARFNDVADLTMLVMEKHFKCLASIRLHGEVFGKNEMVVPIYEDLLSSKTRTPIGHLHYPWRDVRRYPLDVLVVGKIKEFIGAHPRMNNLVRGQVKRKIRASR